MNLLPLLFANLTPPDTMISGDWMLKLIAAMFTGAALILGRYWGKRDAIQQDVTLKTPVPTVNTREEPEYVTMAIFNGHLNRIEASFAKIEEALDSERGIARLANGNLHKRIDALSEKMGERLGNLEGTLKGVAETTHTLLDIALGKKPPTR
jgi:hypothetical protein